MQLPPGPRAVVAADKIAKARELRLELVRAGGTVRELDADEFDH